MSKNYRHTCGPGVAMPLHIVVPGRTGPKLDARRTALCVRDALLDHLRIVFLWGRSFAQQHVLVNPRSRGKPHPDGILFSIQPRLPYEVRIVRVRPRLIGAPWLHRLESRWTRSEAFWAVGREQGIQIQGNRLYIATKLGTHSP